MLYTGILRRSLSLLPSLDSTSHSLNLTKKHHLPLMKKPFVTKFTFSSYFEKLKILLSIFHVREVLLLQFLFILFILHKPKKYPIYITELC